MPRPARSLWVTRSYARRRHRNWMVSMSLASLGWGTWWVLLFVKKIFDWRPESLFWPGLISTLFAGAGLAFAVACLRARRTWLLFVMIPILANVSLLFLPWLAEELTSRQR